LGNFFLLLKNKLPLQKIPCQNFLNNKNQFKKMMSPKSKCFPFSLGFIGGGLSSAIGKTHFGASQLDVRCKVEAVCSSRQVQNNRDA
jgi:hypothetical protein